MTTRLRTRGQRITGKEGTTRSELGIRSRMGTMWCRASSGGGISRRSGSLGTLRDRYVRLSLFGFVFGLSENGWKENEGKEKKGRVLKIIVILKKCRAKMIEILSEHKPFSTGRRNKRKEKGLEKF